MKDFGRLGCTGFLPKGGPRGKYILGLPSEGNPNLVQREKNSKAQQKIKSK